MRFAYADPPYLGQGARIAPNPIISERQMTDRLKERLRDVLLDWDGSTMPDGAETRVTLSCGEIRDTLDRITQLEAALRGIRDISSKPTFPGNNLRDIDAIARAALHQGDRKP